MSSAPAAARPTKPPKSAGQNRFTTSKRFLRKVDSVFKQTISQAELYVAFLLLNHELNKLPIGKRYEPPTKEYVERMLKTHSTSGSVLTRDEFLALAQSVFCSMSGAVLRHVVCLFVITPVLGMLVKRALSALLLREAKKHPRVEKAIALAPTGLLMPVSSGLVDAVLPVNRFWK